MNKAVTLSLVIPVYNEEHHLAQCLESVKAQLMAPDEVILVDNNSTDSSAAIAKGYPFVRIIKEKKQGIVFARNAGYNTAKGDIICRTDGDSVLPPDWIKRINDFYTDDNHMDCALSGGVYFCNVRLPRFNGWVQGQLAFRLNRFITGHYIVTGANMAVPRRIWLSVRSHCCSRTDIHEDMDLAIHMHQLGYHITYHEINRVGVYIKYLWQNRAGMLEYGRRWPRTLRVHHYGHWRLAAAGNFFVALAVAAIYIGELLARIAGKKSIT